MPGAVGTIQWGPDGRDRAQTSPGNGATNYSQAHWDGESILFDSSYQQGSSGSSTLYIGKAAIMDRTGNLTVLDRDQSGTSPTSHGIGVSTWYKGWTLGPLRQVQLYNPKLGHPMNVQIATGSCDFVGGPPQYQYYQCPGGPGADYGMIRADGYSMLHGVVQGARTYDLTSGQWLTPDPYAGDVHDPMSQKPFMWNNNNPIEYSDPSGYCTLVLVDCVAEGIAALGATVGSSAATGGIVAGIMALTTARTAPGTLSQRERGQQIRGATFAVEHGESEERENGTRPAEDKKASAGEIKQIEDLTGESIEETKTGGSHAGGTIIVRDTKGYYHVKPASGIGPGEPLGINRGELPKAKPPNTK